MPPSYKLKCMVGAWGKKALSTQTDHAPKAMNGINLDFFCLI